MKYLMNLCELFIRNYFIVASKSVIWKLNEDMNRIL